MSHSAPARPMTSRRSGPLTGDATVPGDKSISHRALILGALAVGETRITGLLEGEDVLDTAKAMRAFGAEVTQHGPGDWSVHGVGVGGFRSPEGVIDCGNSGTGVRLIMGAMATTDITATFTGDASLSRRPMARVTVPLAQLGARITAREGDRLPITIEGAADPVPLTYRTPVASAQIKSAILLAGLNVPGDTVVIESEPTRDHSERMLAGFGAEIRSETTDEGHRITLKGRPELRAQPVAVPRDPSSAAFPVAAALIGRGAIGAGAFHAGGQVGAVLADIALADVGPDAKAVIPVSAPVARHEAWRPAQVAQTFVAQRPQQIVIGRMGEGGMGCSRHVQQTFRLLNTPMFNERQDC